MIRKPLALLASMVILFAFAPGASAESQTVDGTGDIKKMYANNGENALTVKVYGIGKPCDGARHFTITVKWGQDSAYKVEAGCYGADWAESLWYLEDRSDPESAKEVNCDGFRVTYNSDKTFHKAVMSRN